MLLAGVKKQPLAFQSCRDFAVRFGVYHRSLLRPGFWESAAAMGSGCPSSLQLALCTGKPKFSGRDFSTSQSTTLSVEMFHKFSFQNELTGVMEVNVAPL